VHVPTSEGQALHLESVQSVGVVPVSVNPGEGALQTVDEVQEEHPKGHLKGFPVLSIPNPS